MLIYVTACVKANQAEQTDAKPVKVWQTTQYANLIRYVPSGIFFARLRANGNLIRNIAFVKASRRMKIQVKILHLKFYPFDVLKLANSTGGRGDTAAANFKTSVTGVIYGLDLPRFLAAISSSS